MCGVSPIAVSCDTTLAPRRCMKPSPLLPTAVTSMPTPAASHCFIWLTTRRNALVLRPPHRPLSEVTTMRPTRLTLSRAITNGCLYSGWAYARCVATRAIFSAYGRADFMRSCALRILDAATISMALVILRVFSTLLILVRISFPAAIVAPNQRGLSIDAGFLELFHRGGQRLFGFAVEIAAGFDGVHDAGVLRLHERLQCGFERQDLVDFDIVHVAVVDGEQGQRHLRNRHR